MRWVMRSWRILFLKTIDFLAEWTIIKSRGDTMKRFALAFLLCLPALAADPWTGPQIALEGVAEIGIAMEWAQMLPRRQTQPSWGNSPTYDVPICGIDARIMGHYPPRRRINLYFAAWELAHPCISYVLPSMWRTAWLGSTIGFEVAVNQRNASVGCKLHF
jgi:hypothetical protein